MKLRASQPHRYFHRATGVLYPFTAGEEKEVPDEVGYLLLSAYPERFNQIVEEVGAVADPLVAAVEEAPGDTMVRRSRRNRVPRSPQVPPAEA